jgi:hypothetical protein
MQDLDGLAGADRPLDADWGRLSEGDVDAVVAGEGGLDDLFLDLAVERNGDLVAAFVLPGVDQGVLLGELAECDPESGPVVGLEGTTTDSTVGGGNWCPSAGAGTSPIQSPI